MYMFYRKYILKLTVFLFSAINKACPAWWGRKAYCFLYKNIRYQAKLKANWAVF